ncbi:MAG: hypothetical protein ABIH26_16075 [Candidatus Eisenbacteria bacterium]
MSERTRKADVEEAWEVLREAAARAVEVLVELLNGEDQRLRLRAALAVLDRAGIVEAKGVPRGRAGIGADGFEPFEVVGLTEEE